MNKLQQKLSIHEEGYDFIVTVCAFNENELNELQEEVKSKVLKAKEYLFNTEKYEICEIGRKHFASNSYDRQSTLILRYKDYVYDIVYNYDMNNFKLTFVNARRFHISSLNDCPDFIYHEAIVENRPVTGFETLEDYFKARKNYDRMTDYVAVKGLIDMIEGKK